MGSHRHSDRRRFLTESAALASLAVGAVQSAGAQTSPEARLKDTLTYGQPSPFDNTVRKALGGGSPITARMTTPHSGPDGISRLGLHPMDHVNGFLTSSQKQHRC